MMHFAQYTSQKMQSTQPISNVVDSVQNKELLWATLQESGAFAGLARDQFQPVQSAFDRTVQQAAKSMAGSSSLSDVNKHIIREFMQSLRSVHNPIQKQNNNDNAPKKKKIEVVYRAEDIQNERASEFERQLREKQTEMDSFLTLKKPTDVNFTDTAVDEDKPIGDEMSRLIAQELAARERELVQLKPEDIARAQQWIGTDSNVTPGGMKKSVSFSNMTNVVEEEHEVEQFEPNEPINNFINENEFEETNSIFSKFKKIKDETTNVVTLQQVYEKLLELERRIDANHAEIMRLFNDGRRV
jgi:hypothetical protein